MSEITKPTILLVEDEPVVRDALVTLLTVSGYEVCAAIHGIDALGHLKRKVPAIVISDLNMPQMSGFEFLSVVRRRFPQVAVIAMSGAYDSGDGVPGGVIAFLCQGTQPSGNAPAAGGRTDKELCGPCGGPRKRIRSSLDTAQRK